MSWVLKNEQQLAEWMPFRSEGIMCGREGKQERVENEKTCNYWRSAPAAMHL